jgi:hypothetical protein
MNQPINEETAKKIIRNADKYLINLIKKYLKDKNIIKKLNKHKNLNKKRKYLTGGAVLPLAVAALSTILNLLF